MSFNRANRFVITVAVCMLATKHGRAEEDQTPNHVTGRRTGLTFCCNEHNDLYRGLIAGGESVARCDTVAEAVNSCPRDEAVLILADGYPTRRTSIDPKLLDVASGKHLKLYIEFPDAIPGIEFGELRSTSWERAVVASSGKEIGLPNLHLLTLHDCRILDTTSNDPLLVMARVAGFDSAVYGLPDRRYPILVRDKERNLWYATTQLSNFVTARYAPTQDWVTMWTHLLALLDPQAAPHHLQLEARVGPEFGPAERLPADAEARAFDRFSEWFLKSRLLISRQREPQIRRALLSHQEETACPGADEPAGDGTRGILEGFSSHILPDGSQMQRTPIRADCQAESAAALALHALVSGDQQSKQVATNLLNYLYLQSELQQGDRGNPQHPAYGLVAWGAISPSWQIGNYGDDNARMLLASMAGAASLESSTWDAAMLKALLSNLRTTGQLGFRGDRIDMAPLEQNGWKHYWDSKTLNYSPCFEAYSWACFLWAYSLTGEREFLDRTKTGIRMMMEAYPDKWRWGDSSERGRMLLPLAWLVRVEDTPQHRRWLKQVADDLISIQQTCGAIPDRLRGKGAGHYVVPASNEAYGTSETPLIQENGDAVSDQLYTTGFTLLGLHEAVDAIGDSDIKAAEDKLADYVVRIQVHSPDIPYLHGSWFRAFDYKRWDYWASSADMGWGAWCAESGWGPTWNGIVLGLRLKETSLWDLTRSSKIGRELTRVQELMAANNGEPWKPGSNN